MVKTRSPLIVFSLLGILALGSIILFMSWHVTPYALPFRFRKVAMLVLMAYSISVSTVLFQTITGNKILTPSIMGFDQLYILIQTTLLFFLGTTHLPGFSPEIKFLAETAIIVIFSSALFFWLFGGSVRGLHLTLLIGVVCGGLFFSLRMLMQLMLDPDAALRLTDIMFANFNRYNDALLLISTIITIIVTLIGFFMLNRFDVLTLGRDTAISLGIPYRRTVMTALILISVLVSVSTALVGPVTFFGLLVASLAYQLSPSARHAVILPIAVLLGIIFLVGGQFILEHVFNMAGRLTFIIEFSGGIVFLCLLIKGKLR